MMVFLRANKQDDYLAASQLFREYAEGLNIDLSFQHFEEELTQLPIMYGKHVGGIILCKMDEAYCGCVAVRKLNEQTCEMKRMYVQAPFRRRGIAQQLLLLAEALAIECNYTFIKLDTLNYMSAAMNLYESNGYKKTKPYYHNPEKSAVFFEKKL